MITLDHMNKYVAASRKCAAAGDNFEKAKHQVNEAIAEFIDVINEMQEAGVEPPAATPPVTVVPG